MQIAEFRGLLAIPVCVALVAACSSPGQPENPARESASATRANAAATSATAPAWDPQYVLGGVDTDQPCIASVQAGDVARLGITPQELESMVFDPWEASGLPVEVTEEPPWFPMWWSGDVPNDYLADLLTPDEDSSHECEILAGFGRVMGYHRDVTTDNEVSELEGEAALAQPAILASVHLFQTEAGASAFLRWLPDHARPHVGDPADRQTQPLPEAGTDAVLVSNSSKWGHEDLALVRRGTIVGEVTVVGPKGRAPDAPASALAVALAERIESAPRTGRPYDIGQMMSAPMPLDQWGAEYAAFAADSQFGGMDYWEQRYWVDDADDPAPPESSHPLFGYQASYSPEELDWPIPRVATELTVFDDAGHASAAVDRWLSASLLLPGVERFDVPGVGGAVGVRTWTTDAADPTWDNGYTWTVALPRDRSVARVIIEYGAAEDAAQAHDRQKVIDVARAWVPRLDRILGSAPSLATPAATAGPSSIDQPTSTGAPAEEPGIVLTAPQTPQRNTISAGSFHTCALDPAGRPWCWGYNQNGALGNGRPPSDNGEYYNATPVAVTGGRSFTTISSGGLHTCALDGAGRAWCWGSDYTGALGDGNGMSDVPRATPGAVAGGHTWATISAGGRHTCGLDTAGRAWCWGEDALGQAGDGGDASGQRPPDKDVPVAVSGGHTFVDIDAGNEHTCALDTTGAAWCWGEDSAGPLGDGPDALPLDFTPVVKDAPVAVLGGHTFATISAGESHTCALDGSGRAWCWGLDGGGELGDGVDVGPEKPAPVAVVGGHAFTALDTGGSTCALDAAGSPWCWGEQAQAVTYQDGEGGRPLRSTPVPAPGTPVFAAVSLGSSHACALDRGGSAFCWGSAEDGLLGTGAVEEDPLTDEVPPQPSPAPVAGTHTFATP